MAAEGSKKEPLVSTENTPLTGGSSSSATAGELTGQARQMATVGSLASLVGIAVLKTQLTALLFRYSNYPTAYSLWSCVVTDVLLIPFFLVRPKSFAFPTRAMAGVLTLIVVFTAFDLGFTNIALSRISTALQQCVAATNPFWTIVFESALYQRMQHPLTYLTVIGLVVGAVLASLGNITRLDTFGVVAAVVAVLCSSSKYVFTHKAFQAFKGELGALALLFWVDLFMIPIYLVWTIANGELQLLFTVAFTDMNTFWSMTGTAALGGVRALTQYVVLVFVSATSMSTANIFTQIFNIILSLVIQSDEIDVTGALVAGIVTVMAFSSFYAFIKAYKPFLPAVDELLCGKRADKAGLLAGKEESGSATRNGWKSHLSGADAQPVPVVTATPIVADNRV